MMVVAWDRVGNRASDAGRIMVHEVERNPAAAPPAQVDPVQPSDLNPAPVAVSAEAEAEQIRAQPWIWPAIAWIGLMSAVGFAKVSDPRARALRELHDDISTIRDALKE
ncbi:MAG: hypothetical protein ACC700_05030 [Anaerolineales bacterium]